MKKLQEKIEQKYKLEYNWLCFLEITSLKKIKKVNKQIEKNKKIKN